MSATLKPLPDVHAPVKVTQGWTPLLLDVGYLSAYAAVFAFARATSLLPRPLGLALAAWMALETLFYFACKRRCVCLALSFFSARIAFARRGAAGPSGRPRRCAGARAER